MCYLYSILFFLSFNYKYYFNVPFFLYILYHYFIYMPKFWTLNYIIKNGKYFIHFLKIFCFVGMYICEDDTTFNFDYNYVSLSMSQWFPLSSFFLSFVPTIKGYCFTFETIRVFTMGMVNVKCCLYLAFVSQKPPPYKIVKT